MPIRSVSIDAWKTAAILGVVWIHCGFLVPHAPALLDVLSPIFGFAVPLFLLFWAYFAEKATANPRWSWTGSLWRARSLLQGFLIWSSVYWILKGDFESPLASQVSRYWSGYGWSGQYFFLVLLQLIVGFPALRWLASRIDPWTNILGSVLLLTLATRLPPPPELLVKIGDRVFLYWVPFVVAGIHLARRPGAFPRVHWSVGVAAALSIPLLDRLLPGNLGRIGPYLQPSTAIAAFLIGTSAVKGAMPRWLATGLPSEVASWISRRTLAIFCMNPLFVVLAERIAVPWGPLVFPLAGIVVPALTTVAVTALCLGLAEGFKRIGLGFAVRN